MARTDKICKNTLKTLSDLHDRGELKNPFAIDSNDVGEDMACNNNNTPTTAAARSTKSKKSSRNNSASKTAAASTTKSKSSSSNNADGDTSDVTVGTTAARKSQSQTQSDNIDIATTVVNHVTASTIDTASQKSNNDALINNNAIQHNVDEANSIVNAPAPTSSEPSDENVTTSDVTTVINMTTTVERNNSANNPISPKKRNNVSFIHIS